MIPLLVAFLLLQPIVPALASELPDGPSDMPITGEGSSVLLESPDALDVLMDEPTTLEPDTVTEETLPSEPAPEEPSSEEILPGDEEATSSSLQLGSGGMAGLPIALERGASGINLEDPTIAANTGALTYTYPIELPKSRGVTPDLSLTYNSQDTRDQGYGYGWSLSIPSIERLPKHGVDQMYESDDYFTSSLSGELVKTATSTYAAKRERGDFLDYTFAGNVWTVHTKTGLTYVFGKTAASRMDNSSSPTRTFSWMLSEIVDLNNNVVRYSYYKNAGYTNIFPAAIEYPIWRNPATGVESAAVFQVTINSGARSSTYGIPTSGRAGFRTDSDRSLGSIVIEKLQSEAAAPMTKTSTHADALLNYRDRGYTIAYTAGKSGKRMLLSSITPYWFTGESTTKNGPATEFSYTTSSAGQQNWSESTWGFPTDSSSSTIRFPEGDPRNAVGTFGNSRLADVNGDALIDILSSKRTYINSGTSSNIDALWAMPYAAYPTQNCTGTFQLSLDTPRDNGTNGSVEGRNVHLVDVNGDGRSDVLATTRVTCQSASYYYSAVFMSATSGWELSGWQVPVMLGVDSNGDDTGSRIADVNGDGLPDLITSIIGSTPMFYFNTGSGWQHRGTFSMPTVPWCNVVGQGVVSKPLAFYDPTWRITTPLSFEDMNGDGLADLVMDGYFCSNLNESQTGYANAVYINNGSTWAYEGSLYTFTDIVPGNYRVVGDPTGDSAAPDFLYVQANGNPAWAQYRKEGVMPLVDQRAGALYNEGVDGASGGADRQWTYPTHQGCDNYTYKVAFQQSFKPSGGSAVSAPSAIQTADLNGDGLMDLFALQAAIPCATDSNPARETKFWKNQSSGKVDLLSSISYPHHGAANVTYAMASSLVDASGTKITAGAPVNVAVVTRIEKTDGYSPASGVDYSYSGGAYRFGASDDREFAGFRKVIEKDAHDATSATWFHQGNGNDAASYEDDDHASKVGLPYRTEKRTSGNALRASAVTRYARISASSLSGDRYFVAATTTLETHSESNGTTASKGEARAYDTANGNLTSHVDYGDVTASSDGTFTDAGGDAVVTTAYAYATASGTGTPWVKGFVSQETKTDGASAVLWRAKTIFDGLSFGQVSKGNATEGRRLISNAGGVEIEAVTTSGYDAKGLVTSATDTLGHQTVYGYDQNALYPATETRTINGTQHVTSSYYHWTLGLLQGSSDPSGVTEFYDYDGLGRPLVRYRASPQSYELWATEDWVYNDTTAWASYAKPGASARHNKNGYRTGYITITYSDGLGRGIRSVKFMPDPSDISQSAYSVTDTRYDNRGQVAKTSLPFLATTSQYVEAWRPDTVVAPAADARWTIYAYDDMGRVATKTTGIGTTTVGYGARATDTTDPLGRTKTHGRDAHGRLVQVLERNRNAGGVWEAATTTYAYDPLGNLAQITDAESNVRAFSYDMLGRRTAAEDLHASGDATYGLFSFAYDTQGNLTSATNADGVATVYTYDALNRSATETAGGIFVRAFGYDSCPMGKGRVCSDTSATATVRYEYDGFGLVLKNTTSYASASVTHVTSYDRDYHGLIWGTDQPDGSRIENKYRDGFLTQVWRKEANESATSSAVTSIVYNPLGQVTEMRYPNGAVTTNTYDADKLFRLTRKTTAIPLGSSATTSSLAGSGGGGVGSDATSTWQTLNSSLNRGTSMAFHPTDKNVMYFGTMDADGVYKTTDGGANWSKLTNGLPTNPIIYWIAVDPTTPSTVYVTLTAASTSNKARIYKSTSSGSSWGVLSGGLPTDSLWFFDVVIDPADHNKVYLCVYGGTNGNGVWKSTNAGGNWTRVYTGASARILTMDPNNGNKLYAGTAGGFIARSTDGGATWTDNLGPYHSPHTIVIDPASSTLMFASGGDAIAKSTNGGTTWTSLTLPTAEGLSGPHTMAMDSYVPNQLYLLSRYHLYYSTDSGANWTDMSTGFSGVVNRGLGYNKSTNVLYAFLDTDPMYLKRGSPLPRIDNFKATPGMITAGNSTTLSWTLTGGLADTVTIDQGVGSVFGQSSTTVAPSATTMYTISASNSAGTVSATTTVTTSNLVVQDVSYTYDLAGNITQTVDASDTSTKKTVTYTYDDLDRLKSATAVNGATPLYTEAYTYSPIGNLLSKVTSVAGGASATSTYAYAGDQGSSYANPHAATSITMPSDRVRTLTYDKSGNVVDDRAADSGTLDPTSVRLFNWTANGRLASSSVMVSGATSTLSYSYSASGERLTQSGTSTLLFTPTKTYNATLSVDYGDTEASGLDTAILTGPASVTWSATATFSFLSNELSATFECKLDAGSWTSCSSPKTYTGVATGTHSFSVRAVTSNGTDTTPDTQSWTVGTEPAHYDTPSMDTSAHCGHGTSCHSGNTFTLPVVISQPNEFLLVNVYQNAPYCSGSVTAAYNSATMTSTATVDHGGATYWQFELMNPAQGTNDLVVTKPSGGCDLGITAAAFTGVDVTTPHGTLGTAHGASADTPTVNVVGSSGGLIWSGMVSPNAGTFAPTTSGMTVVLDTSGTPVPMKGATLSASGTVATAWQITNPGCCAYWDLISTPLNAPTPQTSLFSGPGATTSSTTGTFEFDSNDANATFECKLDGGSWTSCASPKTYSSLAAGQHTFLVRGVNAQGADSSPETHVWTIGETLAYSILGDLSTKHIFAGDILVATVEGSTSTAVARFIHTDHLSGINAVTSATGSLIELLDYKPFGEIGIDEKSGAWSEQRKYAGHEFDTLTELSYMEARYYDPTTARFMSLDPVFLALGDRVGTRAKTGQGLDAVLSDPQGLNSYAYARNNPLRYVDPTGNAYVEASLGGKFLLFAATFGFRIDMKGIDVFVSGGPALGGGVPGRLMFWSGDLSHEPELTVSVGGNAQAGAGGGISYGGQFDPEHPLSFGKNPTTEVGLGIGLEAGVSAEARASMPLWTYGEQSPAQSAGPERHTPASTQTRGLPPQACAPITCSPKEKKSEPQPRSQGIKKATQ